MAGLKAFKGPYEPGYPRSLTDQQIKELLRPNLLRRFGKEVMLTGALLTGLLSSGCRSSEEEKNYPPIGNSQKPYEEAQQELELAKTQKANLEKKAPKAAEASSPKTKKKTVQTPNISVAQRKAIAWSKEVLGRIKPGFWNKRSGINLIRELPANPPVKYPRIEISYGNSYCGVFDIEEAKKITHELFKIYGLELKSDVPLKGTGYDFKADGYDEKLKIGFEIVGHGYHPAEKDFKLEVLSPLEFEGLNKDITNKKRQIFVANINQLPNMDGDLYTPKQYYMASVIDYLNWVRGDVLYKHNEILGTFPTSMRSRLKTVLPGSSFKSKNATTPWKMLNSTSTFTDSPSTKAYFVATLAAGNTLRYEPETAVTLPKRYSQYRQFSLRLLLEDPKTRPKKFQIKLSGENGKTVEEEVKFGNTILNPSARFNSKLPFKILKVIEIKNLGDKVATFKILDISHN
ncbi:MAG: hypothetical protein P1V97_13970 [Planctomycetota bacterium]|nr:hypothetical protein [Planctomycetota bacterium]